MVLCFLSGFKTLPSGGAFLLGLLQPQLPPCFQGARKVVMNPNHFRGLFSHTVPSSYTGGPEADTGQGGVVVGWKAPR